MSDEGHIPTSQAMDMNRVIAEFYEEMSEAFSQIPSVCDPDVCSALASMHRALHKLAEAVTGCPAGVRMATPADYRIEQTSDIGAIIDDEPVEARHPTHDANRKAY